MTVLRCPTCRQSFQRTETTAMPFCSERCRLIDLGRWVDERNSVSVEREIDSDEEPSFQEPAGLESE